MTVERRGILESLPGYTLSLQRIRERRGVTIDELADYIGTTPEILVNIENGIGPGIYIYEVLHALDVSVNPHTINRLGGVSDEAKASALAYEKMLQEGMIRTRPPMHSRLVFLSTIATSWLRRGWV